jgi:subtilisin family serine protease
MLVVFLAWAQALAAPPAAEHPRLSGPLRTAHGLALEASPDLETWRSARPGPNDPEGIIVVIEGGDPEAVADELERVGADVEIVTSAGVQAWVAYESLGEASELEGVARVREPFMAHAKGSAQEKGLFSSNQEEPAMTEGVTAMEVEPWHTLGFEGNGVEVAILDVGFAAYEDYLGVELPKTVSTEMADAGLDTTPHGTAVAEIVHDVAPDAKLLLYEFRTDIEFLDAVDVLESRGIDVVNASIGFDNIWHADGTSEYSRAVNRLVASGTVWVGAAGNENDKYAVGQLSDDDRDGLLEIEGQEGIWVAAWTGQLQVSFRWSESMTAPTRDIDLVAYNEDMTECARSSEPQVGEGSKPYESIDALCKTQSGWVLVYPFVEGTPVLSDLDGFLYGSGSIDQASWSNERNLTLPGDAEGAISVGACVITNDPPVPYYSSRGPTDDGRIKPNICGPTDVTTASYGPGAFMGTSAASPHVAGLATLVVEALGKRDPDAVKDWIYSNALDLGEPGEDDIYGYGAAQAGPAPRVGCSCGLTSMKGAWIFVGAALWVGGRRRSSWLVVAGRGPTSSPG